MGPAYIQEQLVKERDDIFKRTYPDGRITVIRDRYDEVQNKNIGKFTECCKEFTLFTGIQFPKWAIVFDENLGRYVIETEFIDGINLDEMYYKKDVDLDFIEDVYCNYVRYLIFAYKNNKPFISDFKLSQLIIKEGNIYNIDLDFFARNPYGTPENSYVTYAPIETELHFIISTFLDILKEVSIYNSDFGMRFFALIEMNLDIKSHQYHLYRRKETHEVRSTNYPGTSISFTNLKIDDDSIKNS